jgi:phospholipid transport system substrate-binding protein
MATRPALRAGIIGLALTLVGAHPQAEPAAAGDASACIERLHTTLLQVMKGADELRYDGRAQTLEPTVNGAYDFAFMARKSVGRHWKTLSEEERDAFVARFEGLTIANYAGRFTGWEGESFETVGEETGVHDTRLLMTIIVGPDDDDVNLDYRLHKTASGWRIIDVYMNGTISELAMRRSEYSALLRREGFPSLIEALDKKIGDFSEG